MHFSKLITAFVVVAATGAFASPSFRQETADLAGPGMEGLGMEGLHGGAEAGAFESEMAEPTETFSEAPGSSLESASRTYCWYGRCLHRHYRWRRCPWGSRVVGYRRCGYNWWYVRAICCRYRRCLTGNDEAGLEADHSEIKNNELD